MIFCHMAGTTVNVAVSKSVMFPYMAGTIVADNVLETA